MDTEEAWVADPMMTDAEFIHRKAQARERGKDTPRVGKILVQRNAKTRIGGLAYIRRRMDHHERAAERFLNLYEGRYGRVAPAIDLGRVRVDMSIIGHDGEMVSAIDRTAAIRDAEDYLGKSAFRLVVGIICLGSTCSDMAPETSSRAPTGRSVDAVATAVLDALDRLSELWQLKGGRAA